MKGNKWPLSSTDDTDKASAAALLEVLGIKQRATITKIELPETKHTKAARGSV